MALLLVFLVSLVTTTPAQLTAGHTTTTSAETNDDVTFDSTTSSLPTSGCGNTSFYGPSGVISSPNYPDSYYNDLNCDYNIYAPTGSSLSFFFKSFHTEDGYDFVTISCPKNSSFTSQEFSGHSLPNPVSIPWCSQGRVSVSTDNSTVFSGFSLDYYVSLGGCGNTVYSDSSGYITSPNWPNDYGYNQNCSNIIWAPQRSTFYVYFESFSLQGCCTCDWLEISCVDNSTYGSYRYCGPFDAYYLYIYKCSQVLLWFHSDGYSNYPGFNILYNIYPDSDGETNAKSSDSQKMSLNTR